MTQDSIEDISFYADLLADIKQRIQQGQTRAALSANAEMLMTITKSGNPWKEVELLELICDRRCKTFLKILNTYKK